MNVFVSRKVVIDPTAALSRIESVLKHVDWSGAEPYSEPSRKSKIEFFAEVFNN